MPNGWQRLVTAEKSPFIKLMDAVMRKGLQITAKPLFPRENESHFLPVDQILRQQIPQRFDQKLLGITRWLFDRVGDAHDKFDEVMVKKRFERS